MTHKKRAGFTLVELLAVIAIIGILVGLTLPAVAMVREMARRAACANNMRNLGVGAAEFETSNPNKGFPGYLQAFGVHKTAPLHVKVGTWAVALLPYVEQQQAYDNWSDDSISLLTSSGAAYDQNKIPQLAVFVCPSDTRFDGDFGNNSYVYNSGFWVVTPSTKPTSTYDFNSDESAHTSLANGIGVCKYNYSDCTKLLGASAPTLSSDFPKAKNLTSDDVKDGRSQTLLISENLMAKEWHRVNPYGNGDLPGGLFTNNASDAFDGWRFSRVLSGMVWFDGGDLASMLTPMPPSFYPVPGDASSAPSAATVAKINGDMITRRSGNFDIDFGSVAIDAPAVYASPSSEHRGGVNAAFVDGTVRYLSEKMDYDLYCQLMSTYGKKSGHATTTMNYKSVLVNDAEL